MLLDIRGVSILADYFIIASMESSRQARALVDGIRQGVKQSFNLLPLHVEGTPDSGWVLVDYGDVVIHLFTPAVRAYYNLEGLWREGKIILRML